MKHFDLANLPLPLREKPHWVRYRLEPNSDGKITKIPYQVRNPEAKGSSTNPETWAPFAEAIKECPNPTPESGLGFVFTKSGLTGIDLDHAIVPETGEFYPWAEAIVARFDSYAELSPGGLGIHILIRGEMPGGKGHKRAYETGAVEAYSSGRFFTMTGRHLSGTPLTIEPRQDVLTAFVAELWPEKAERPRSSAPLPSLSLDDQAVLDHCRRARNSAKFMMLYDRGDAGEYGNDDSRADSALAALLGFYTQDTAQVERLMRTSALRRDKWDEPRPGGTWLSVSVQNALATLRETYDPQRCAEVTTNGPATRLERPPALGDTDAPPETGGNCTQTPVDESGNDPFAERANVETLGAPTRRDPEIIFSELLETTEDEARLSLLHELASAVAADPFQANNYGARIAKEKLSTKKAFLDVVDVEYRKCRDAQKGQPRPAAAWSGDGERLGPKKVGDMLKDAPNIPDLVIPERYYLRENATGRYPLVEGGEPIPQQIACAPIIITGRLRQVTTAAESLCLCWREGHRWREKIVDRGQAMDARKLIELANDGFPVASDNAKDIVAYLRKFEAANLPQLPVANVSGSMGWQGKDRKDGFLWGTTHILPTGEIVHSPDSLSDSTRQWRDDVIAFRAASVGDEQIVAGYHSKGTFEDWKKAVTPAMAHPRARVALYTSVAVPLLSVLGCPNFIVDFAHPTSVGKTTLLRIAASVWGNPTLESPTSAMWTWDMTRVFAERGAAVMGGLPLILDDTKRARKVEMVSDLIYTVTSGRGRGRGSVQGIAETAIWSTILMSSGEEPATSFTTNGGVKTRVLEITGMPFGATTETLRKLVENVNRGITFNYGHAGVEFIRWFVRNRAREGQFAELYEKRVEHYATLAKIPEAGRLAQYAAAIYVAGILLHEALELPWEFDDPFAELWEMTAEESRNASGHAQALSLVEGWCYSNRERFHGITELAPTLGWLGRWEEGEDGWIGIFPNALREMLTRAGYKNPEGILRGWRDMCWIRTDSDQQRYVKRVRLPAADGNGPRVNLVVIPLETFEKASLSSSPVDTA